MTKHQDDSPTARAAADVSAMLDDLPGLRAAVKVAERAAADLLAQAHDQVSAATVTGGRGMIGHRASLDTGLNTLEAPH
jgi:hypothetical protein